MVESSVRWRELIGPRVAEARKKLGITQDELGDRVGVTKGAISQQETGATVPSLETLIALSQALGVSLDWFLGLGDEPLDVVQMERRKVSGMGLISKLSLAIENDRLQDGDVELLSRFLDRLAK